jgi:hypothetical protein
VTGLASSPFAHHYSGNRGCFLFLWVLRCFTSPRFLHLPYVFRQGRWAITPNQVSPFGNPRVKVWLPTNRGLSQAPTSFIGSWCQGIHRVPLSTWQLQMMLASTVQFSRYGRSRPCDALGGEGTGPGRGAAFGIVTMPWRPFPQDPTACSARSPPEPAFRAARAIKHEAAVLTGPAMTLGPNNQCSTNELATSERMPEMWLWTRQQSKLCRRASCSLERR